MRRPSLLVSAQLVFGLSALAASAQDPLGPSILEGAKLTASDGGSGDVFGVAVAISGDTVVVGSPFAQAEGSLGRGAAYLYEKGTSDWMTGTQVSKLFASDGAENDHFGRSLLINGDTVVVGAHWVDAGQGNGQGAVYVFEKPAGGWPVGMSETAKLTASDGQGFEHFGVSVAMSGDTIVIGAWAADVGPNNDQGAVYVFEKPPTGWTNMTHTAKLTASDGDAEDELGRCVTIFGDVIVAGAPKSNMAPTPDVGAAYVFEKPGSGWANATETAKLTASDALQLDFLGGAAVMNSSTIFVGASGDDFGASWDEGSVYVYDKPGPNWVSMTETAKIRSSDIQAFDLFGHSLALEADTLVVGTRMADVDGNENQGAVYLFEKPPLLGWSNSVETLKLTVWDGDEDDELGFSVGISDGTIVGGARKVDVEGNADEGAAYVFDEVTVPVSGCGLGSMGMNGSRRIGGTFGMAMTACSPGAVQAFMFGVPLPGPISINAGVACGGVQPCSLSCNPIVNVAATSLSNLTIPNDVTFVGITLCMQGACIELENCLRITDMVNLTMSG